VTRGLDATLRELLVQSLVAWRLAGKVEDGADGSVQVVCNGVVIRVERAPPAVPFRWMVIIDGRRRGAISIPAVLRQMRSALDPGYARDKVRLAIAPPVLS
jgi:hypothetical protein